MYVNRYSIAAFAAIVSLPYSFTQVTTSCQPLNRTCPSDPALATAFYSIDFTKVKSLPSEWSLANYETVGFGANGAELTFGKRYDAPLIRTNFFFFFGRVDYVVQGAPGKGIVSSMVLLSDDLDEIDWEMTGTGGNHVETNYYGKGVLNYGVAKYVGVTNPTTSFHTYSLIWSNTSLVWQIDGTTVRTLTPAQAGNEYPQTPMKISLSLWDGGDPSEAPGTMNWAGGETPIPPPENYTMFIKSVNVQNANPGQQYQYTDKSGSSGSIKVLNNVAPLVKSSLSSSLAPSTKTTNQPAPFVLPTITSTTSGLSNGGTMANPISPSSSLSAKATPAPLINTKATGSQNVPTSMSNLATFMTSSGSLLNTKATGSHIPPTSVSTMATLITSPGYLFNTKATGAPRFTMPISGSTTLTNSSTYASPSSPSGSVSIMSSKPPISPSIIPFSSGASTRAKGLLGSPTSLLSLTLLLSTASLVSSTSFLGPTPRSNSSSLSMTLGSNKPTIASGSPTPRLNFTAPILPSQSTQAIATTQIVHTTLTTCPVTSTITSNGTPTMQVTSVVSTVFSTSTSTICTQCVAPVQKSASGLAISSPTPTSATLAKSSSVLASSSIPTAPTLSSEDKGKPKSTSAPSTSAQPTSSSPLPVSSRLASSSPVLASASIQNGTAKGVQPAASSLPSSSTLPSSSAPPASSPLPSSSPVPTLSPTPAFSVTSSPIATSPHALTSSLISVSSPAAQQLDTSASSPASPPSKTQDFVTSQIAHNDTHSSMMSSPLTTTIIPPGGLPTQQLTTTVSTILSTSISTVCTKCMPLVTEKPTSPAAHSAFSATTVAVKATSTDEEALSATQHAISESQHAVSTLLQAFTDATADTSVRSRLSYYSSQLNVIANPTATDKPTATSVHVSYITKQMTQVASSSTTVNTAVIPAGIFTPIAESGAPGAAGTLTSSITVGQTSTMASYGVSGTMNGGNGSVAKPTQPAFHGAASNISSPVSIVALLIVAMTAIICL